MSKRSSGPKKVVARASITSSDSPRQPPARPPMGLDDPRFAQLSFDPWDLRPHIDQLAQARGPRAVHQRQNARDVSEARDRIERGDGKATLFAIVQCVEADLIAPPWLAAAFLAKYDHVRNAGDASWDSVFGAPWKPGTNLAAQREELEHMPKIFTEIGKARDAGRSINSALFDNIGSCIGKSGSYVRKIYYTRRQLLPEGALIVRAMADSQGAFRPPYITGALKRSTKKKKSVERS